MLDHQTAETIAAKLGSLQATTWQGESEASLKALAVAPVVIEAAYETPGDTAGTPKVQQVRVEFAPMSSSERAPLYYGRHSAVPGVFLIDAQTAREFGAPLVKAIP